jgi:predicted nucleotide-binding protein
VIEEAHDLFLSKLDSEKGIKPPQNLLVTKGPETWQFDSREEFLAEYESSDSYRFDHIAQDNRLIVAQYSANSTDVHVEFPARPDIEAIFNVFERNVPASKIVTESSPIKVFIGHGHDQQWRDLKDHLHDLHGVDVVAYEIGPRAGLSVKDVLEGMLNDSSFAILVLTGEDQHVDGEVHARQNVVHELGLFQGRLGFTRAVALLEDGVQEFSNILGVNQIRFSKGNIRETFGDVLATIRREFEEQH